MLTLYNLENSRAFRVHWLACELGIPIESRNYTRVGGKKADPAMAKDSGYVLGKSPCLIDNGLRVVESANCMIYLAEKYGHDWPKILPGQEDFAARTRVIGWLDFAETIMTHALAIVYAQWFAPEASDAIEDKASANVQNDLDEVESALADGPYICGQNLTAADIALAFSCEYVLSKKVGTGDRTWPRIFAWLHMLEARPAYQTALRNGPKYDFCLLRK